jgi:GTP-binding protein
MATSNFIDTAAIWLHAGKGGDGAVTFHREKFVAAGGPDGGDGGRGGDIIFVADDNLSTLMDFRYKRKYTAPDGENGRAKRMSGADGDDLVIRVPRGTVLKEAETDLVVADLTGSEPVVVAKGGRGGWGNSHFATPTRQIPKFAKPGLPGEDMHLKLELKVIADVGLIGFPNVGKSTLISIISAARPKIANYHFTTLTPVLGVVRVGPEQSFVCADIPGLIEGAADGVGLGHDFLRHVERCRLLLHVVDVSGCEGRDPKADFEQINHELAGFSAELADRPQIVLGNKCDIATPEQVEEFKQYIEAKGLTFLPISAATRQGVDGLPALVYNRLKNLPPVKVYEAEYYESLQYFQTQLGDSGILDELVAQDVEEDDTIKIGEYEFDYLY